MSDIATAQPVENVSVIILETGDSTTTDANGKYFFGNIPDGLYNILAGKSLYKPQIKTSIQLGGYVCGDANGDALVNVGDAVFLISYVFRSGPAPAPLASGDANGDGSVNVGDAVYEISYIFKSGPTPQC